MILNDGINSLANKVFFNMGTFSCQVQGSHLMEKIKVNQKLTDIQAGIGVILPTPVSPTPISPTYYCSVPFRLVMQNVTKKCETVETTISASFWG